MIDLDSGEGGNVGIGTSSVKVGACDNRSMPVICTVDSDYAVFEGNAAGI